MTTPPELEAAVERVTAFLSHTGGNFLASINCDELRRSDLRTLLHASAEANERASLLQTAVHERCAERDEALKECARYAREAGFATGKLEMSEAAGIVDGWKDRAEAAESALAASEARRGELETENAVFRQIATDMGAEYQRDEECDYVVINTFIERLTDAALNPQQEGSRDHG